MWSASRSATQTQTLYAPDLPQHLPYLVALGLTAILLGHVGRGRLRRIPDPVGKEFGLYEEPAP